MTYHYFKGLKKEIMVSLFTIVFVFIYIQGLICLSLVNEHNYIQNSLEKTTDFSISFDAFRTDLDAFQRLTCLHANFSDLLSSERYVELVGLIGAFSYSFISEETRFYYLSSSLLLSVLGVDLNTTEIIVTTSFSSYYNLSINSLFSYDNVTYIVKDILSVSAQISFFEVLSDVVGKSFHEFALFPQSSLNLSSLENFFSLHSVIRYDRSLLSNLQFNSLLSKISSFDSTTIHLLSFFEEQFITLRYNTVLYKSVFNISYFLLLDNILFLCVTLPILLSLFYFNSIFNSRLKQILRFESLKLWIKGFSKKKTFFGFFSLFLPFYFFLFLLTQLVNFVLILSFGASISIFYTSAMALTLAFLFYTLLQIRLIYSVTLPKQEFYSLQSTSSDELNKFVKSLDPSDTPHPKRKLLIFSFFVSFITSSLLLLPLLSIYSSIIFHFNLYSHFEDLYFKFIFLFNKNVFEYSYIRNESLIFLFGTTITFFVIFSFIFWYNFFPILQSYLRKHQFRRAKDTVNLTIQKKFFKISLSKEHNLKKIFVLLFLSFFLSLPLIYTSLTNTQSSSYYLDVGDIVIYPERTTFDSITLESFLHSPAVRAFLPVYFAHGAVISDINHPEYFYVLDPSRLLEYNKEIRSSVLIRKSFSSSVGAMIDDPTKIILDFRSFNYYLHYFDQELSVRGIVGGRGFQLNATIQDAASYNLFEPKSMAYSKYGISIKNFISTHALEVPLNMSQAKFVFISLNEGYDTKEFIRLLNSVTGIPINALEFKTTSKVSTLPSLISWTLLTSLAVLSTFLSFKLYRNDIYLLTKLNLRGYETKKVLYYKLLNNFIYWLSSAGITIIFSLCYFFILNYSFRFFLLEKLFVFSYPTITFYFLPIIVVLNLFLPIVTLLYTLTNPRKLTKITSEILSKQDMMF